VFFFKFKILKLKPKILLCKSKFNGFTQTNSYKQIYVNNITLRLWLEDHFVGALKGKILSEYSKQLLLIFTDRSIQHSRIT
jgi:hypothetical protein